MRAIYGYLVAPVVKLNNICVGADKIGHMFQQGFQYLFISQREQLRVRLLGSAWETSMPEPGVSEYIEGRLSPATRSNAAIMRWLNSVSRSASGPAGIGGQTKGHFGIATTGVHSRAIWPLISQRCVFIEICMPILT